MIVKIALLVIFIATTIYIGYYSRKKATDVDGFVLGGRKVGPWMSAFAYGTSYFSAVVFIGYAGQFGWKYGLAAFWAGIGNALVGSLLAWFVLGRRTRIMTHHIKATTMPEFFGKRFDSQALRIVSALIIFVFLIPYTASVYNGLGRLFGMAFAIPYEWCVVAMAVVTCIYVVWGGYSATALNDTVQGIIMLVSIVAVIVSVLNGHGGFTQALISLANASDPTVPNGSVAGVFASMFGPDPLNLLGVVVLTSLGTWGLPQMVQKFYAIESESAITKGAIISTIFAIVVAGGSYFLGGFGRLFSDELDVTVNAAGVLVPAAGYDSIIPTMLSGLPDILIGIIVIMVLSASMSTLSSLVLTSSSTLTLDFIKPVFRKRMLDSEALAWMRVLLVVFVVISVVIALVQYNSSITFIAQLMGYSWGALAGSFIAPFLYGLYLKRSSKAAAWVCFAWGVGLTVVNMATGLAGYPLIDSPINCGAIAMVGALVIFPLVSLVTPSGMGKEHIEWCFSGYDERVLVKASEAIGDVEPQQPAAAAAPATGIASNSSIR